MANELFDVDFNSLADDSAISLEEIHAVDNQTSTTTTSTTEDGVTKIGGKAETQQAKDANTQTDEDLIIIDGTEQEDENKSAKEKTKSPSATTSTIKTEDVEDTTADKNKNPRNEGDSSPITPFASLLHEKGFLPNLNWEDFNAAEDKIEALADAMRKEVEFANANFINSFPEELVDLVKAVASGVPFDKLKDNKVAELNYSTITQDSLSEDVSLQKRLVSESLAAKGFNEKKIAKMLNTFEDTDSLEEEANDALVELKEFHKKQQEQIKLQYAEQQKQLEARHQQTIRTINDTVKGTEEIVPGMKLNDSVKNRLIQNMTQIVGQSQDGTPLNFVMQTRAKNPLKFDMAVTYLADITNGFEDWSKIKTTAKTAATKDFKAALGEAITNSGAPKGANATKDNKEALMASLEKMFK